MKKLTEKQQIEFALNHCDEDCRSIIECGCKSHVRAKSKALYEYNINDTDPYMAKDVKESYTYLQSRGKSLPFRMTEKDGWIRFDKRKE